MSAVHKGVVEVDATFQGIIDFCLGCRACEPVCPGLVPYGRTLEGTRAEIVAQRPSWSHRFRGFLLGSVLGSRRSLKFGTGALSLGQRIGATKVAPSRWRRLAAGMRGLQSRPGSVVGHVGGEGRSGRVALLAGCIQDQWFQQVNHAAVELLEMAGYRVEVPDGQTCCGALAAHDGKAPEAHRLAERNSPILSGYDMVVATAAGCSAHLRDYDHWADGGERVGSTALDITVAVARAIETGLLPKVSAVLGPIGIQDPCHLRHAQKVTTEPRLILEAAGHEVVEIDPTGMCCGAAGLYTVLQPEASQELGNRKADQVRSTGVKRVASANPGCEMQLRSALGDGFEIAHPIEWYLQAIRRENPGGIVAFLEESR
jgi:glycolate oxidase iron-sulfur subunit